MNIQPRISTTSPAQPVADYAALNAAALRKNGRLLIQKLFPGVQIRSLQCILGDFVINYKDFTWEDRSTGEAGSDLISALTHVYGHSHSDAERIVAENLGAPAAGADRPLRPIAASGEDQPQRFIKLLDPNADGFTFQTFDDDRARKNPALTRIIQSPPPARDELRKMNEQGAGIFVTVNETDGNGRKSENIKRVRAIWQEDDDAFDGRFPLDPSIVVESSPGKYHRYWLVSDDWPTDEQGRTDFAAVMERMVVSYGCDKNAKDISRVLRVPGFLHLKTSAPHVIRILEASGCRYSRAEIIAAFPPVEQQNKIHPLHQREPRDGDEARIRDALNSINPDDRELWLQCGMALKDELQEVGRQLWDEWSRRSDKYNERDQDATWKSFRRNGIGIGTLFHLGKMAGWRDQRIDRGKPRPVGGVLPRTLAATRGPDNTREMPRPLIRELPAADPFPIDALGHILGSAARGIHQRVRCPLAICGQSVIAAATLAVQGHADVQLPTGHVKPISNFFVTVAETGERKDGRGQRGPVAGEEARKGAPRRI